MNHDTRQCKLQDTDGSKPFGGWLKAEEQTEFNPVWQEGQMAKTHLVVSLIGKIPSPDGGVNWEVGEPSRNSQQPPESESRPTAETEKSPQVPNPRNLNTLEDETTLQAPRKINIPCDKNVGNNQHEGVNRCMPKNSAEMETEIMKWASTDGSDSIGPNPNRKTTELEVIETVVYSKKRNAGKRRREIEPPAGVIGEGKKAKLSTNGTPIREETEADKVDAMLFTGRQKLSVDGMCKAAIGIHQKKGDVQGDIEWAKVGSRPRLQQ